MSCSASPISPSMSLNYVNQCECDCIGCQKERIALLNNSGVQCMERSCQLSEAAMYFQESLKLAGNEFYCLQKQCFSNGSSDDDANVLKKNLYHFQRGVYDEGMRTFSGPITINSKMSSVSVYTATVIFNMGTLYLQMNEDKEAFHCFSQALHIASATILGNEQQDGLCVVAILHNMGYVQYRSGLYEDAIRTYSEALRVLRHSNNSNRVSCLLQTASTLNCLGVLNYHLPRPNIKEAMKNYSESIAIRRSVIGGDRDDEQIAITLNNIGRVHYLNKDDNAAINVYRQSLSARRRLFGNDHADVAATVCNIGQAYHRLGNLKVALEHYEEFIIIAKKCLGGGQHRDVAMILKLMAQIHEKWENYELVHKLYLDALNVGQASLGRHHEEIASTLNQYGNFLYKTGDFDGAINIYNQGLEVERAVFDECHPNIAVTLSNLGNIYVRQESYKAALSSYHEALTIQRRIFGDLHPSVATSLSCIAMIHFRSKFYKKAFSLYQEALVIQLEAYGDSHLEVASTLCSIGLTLFKMKLCSYALEYFQKCLKVRRTLLGPKHRDLVTVLFNIGSIYLELGHTDEGFKLYQEGLTIARSNAQKTNEFSSYLTIINYVGNVHQHRGELDEAMKYFTEALDIQMIEHQQQGKCTEEIAQTFNNIGNLYLQKAQTASMVAAFSNALRYLRLAGKNENELTIAGFDMYDISRSHPECAPVA